MRNNYREMERSMRNAMKGILYAFRRERNFQIELIAAISVSFMAFIFPLSSVERAVIFIMIGVVLALELVNTALERVIDMMKPGLHPYVKVVKDIAAGAVLIMALLSVVVGLIIFLPQIAKLLF